MNEGRAHARLSTIGHNGGINGFNTIEIRIPDTQDLVVLLDNTSRGDQLDAAARGIIDILRDVEAPAESVTRRRGDEEQLSRARARPRAESEIAGRLRFQRVGDQSPRIHAHGPRPHRRCHRRLPFQR
jgi:hypothetical protein